VAVVAAPPAENGGHTSALAAARASDAGRTSDASGEDAHSAVSNEDLGSRMSFYASALQQLGEGKKLVTPASAKRLDVVKLRRTATVLHELVASKSAELLKVIAPLSSGTL
jgi:hypothetical protein